MDIDSIPPAAPVGGTRLRFLLVGAWNSAFGYLCFAALHLLAGDALGAIGTIILAYSLSLPHAFLTQKYFVFRQHGEPWMQLVRFAIANSAVFAANLTVVPVALALSTLDPLVVQLVFVLISAVVSYVLHKHYSFAR